MIALDTSVILAMALDEPESQQFRSIIGREAPVIGWPTLLEARTVLTGKGFQNARAIVDQIVRLPNVTSMAFDEAHYRAAETAFDRFGKGRHPAALNMRRLLCLRRVKDCRRPPSLQGRRFQSDRC